MAIEETVEVVKLHDENTGNWKFIRKSMEQSRSAEIIEKALCRLGLSKNDVRVYLYLARFEERKASEISDALCLHRTETYRILRDLEKQGLVSSVFEKPLKFIATPFRKAIDILIEARKMKIRFLEQKKQTLINAWLSLPQSSVQPERKEAFQVLEGQEQIDLKASEFLEQARNEVIVFAPKADLARLYYSSLLDKLERCSKKNIAVRLLIENSPNSRFFLGKSKLNVRYSSASDIEGLPGFVIADQEQLLLSMTKNGEESKEFSRGRKVSALATNYGAFIRVLRKLFAELWRSKEQLKVAPVSLA